MKIDLIRASLKDTKEIWELSTILEEKGNCYLYEKLGYHPTGNTQVINDRLTLIFYHK